MMDMVARRCGNCHHCDSHTLMPHSIFLKYLENFAEAGAWAPAQIFPEGIVTSVSALKPMERGLVGRFPGRSLRYLR